MLFFDVLENIPIVLTYIFPCNAMHFTSIHGLQGVRGHPGAISQSISEIQKCAKMFANILFYRDF